MYDETKKTYKFASWSKHPKSGVSVLVKNFTPDKEDCMGWNREQDERFTEPGIRRLYRVMWSKPRDKKSRILVDIRETASFEQAQLSLIEHLSNNELFRLPEGPENLGDVSYVHPPGVPPASFWVTGNLCISVYSLGITAVPVLDSASCIHARIMERPSGTLKELSLKPKKKEIALNENIKISPLLPESKSEERYFKWFATGGDLFFEGEEVYFRAYKKGDIQIEAFAVDPKTGVSYGKTLLKGK